MHKTATRSQKHLALLLVAVGIVLALVGSPGLFEPSRGATVRRARAALPITATPHQSSPIALSGNDQLLVNVNPDSNSITLFDVATDTPARLAEIAVGREPRSVAIHPNGTTAYVANAAEGTVSVVDLATRAVTQVLPIGSEPMALALSPNGTLLYVANSSSNNLVVVATASLTVVATVDLSAFGTAPRAIAVTNNGDADDTDETIFVALFFAQLRTGKTALDEGQDDQREGRLVAISAATNTFLGAPNPIVLSPLASTGFYTNGKLAPAVGQVPAVVSTNPQSFFTPSGAFPNQLASIALQPNASRAYVVSTAASPNGPFRFNSNAQGLVSVFSTATRSEITAAQTDPNVRRTAPLNLNQDVNRATTPAPRLFHTNPVAMAWRPDGSDAWVVIQNTDLVVRLTVDANGIPSIGAPLVAGPSTITRVDPQSVAAGQIAGKAPRGIVVNSTGTRAYVYSFVSRSVTTIDISTPTAPTIAGTAQAAALPTAGSIEATAQLGAELFYGGRGPQGRLASEGWGACVVCHPEGRSDNVTWLLDAGPRQTISLDGTFDKANSHDQRILDWSGLRDETQDYELYTRNVFGGRGLIQDDRLFLAIAGATGATPFDLTLIEQFDNYTGQVGGTNDLQDGAVLPSLTGMRRDFGIATLPDGRVFIVGGRSGAGQGFLVGNASAVVEFNPRTNLVTVHSGTGFTPRHSLGAAAVRTNQGVRIYAIGGYASTADTASPVTTVEEYDPDTDTWRTVAPLPQAVAEFGAAVAGGVNTAEPLQLVHVVAGNTGSESVPSLGNLSPVQRFQADPAGPGTWSAFDPPGLTLRRNHGVATALRGVESRVFVIGGQDSAGTVLDTVEEYGAQAITVVATPHTALPAPRARFGIGVAGTTNQIYVMGGVDGAGTDQTTVFEYSVANNGPVAGPAGTPSGTWVTRANLSFARRGLGVSSPPGVTSLLPVQSAGREANRDAIATWIALNVRPSMAPLSPTDAAALRGQALFGTVGLAQPGFSCATCHGGPKWTRSTVDFSAPPSPEIGLGLGNERVIGAELRQTTTQNPAFPAAGQFPGVLVNVGTFTLAGRTNQLRANSADISQAIAPLGANGFNIPSLLSVHETAPYFSSGTAQTLDDVLNGSQDGNGGTRHHFVANASQRGDLVAYLRASAPAAPTPTPTATATSSATPTATSTPTPSATATSSATATATDTPPPSATAAGSATPAATDTPPPSSTPASAATPTPSATPASNVTPTATASATVVSYPLYLPAMARSYSGGW